MSTDPRLDDLLERWEDMLETGQHVSPEELCQDCPELLTELKREIRQMQWVGDLLETGSQHAIDPKQTETPRNLGRYRLDELIGEGGFGQVWRGYDPELDRLVAVKVLRPERHKSVFQVARFIDEAKKVAKLRHQNIVAIHDVGRHEGFCFMVTDFIEGVDLGKRIKMRDVPTDEAVEIIAKVADALHHAHQQGIIHRDVKPQNILLGSHNEPVITDFGIAVTEDAGRGGDSDNSGTPAYMAPEQTVAGGGPIDARTDIFCLGVVLYELVSGKRPFEIETLQRLRERPEEHPPPSLRSLDASIPAALDGVCMKALTVAPEGRWSDAGQFAQALRDCLNAGQPKEQRRVSLIAVGLLLIVALTTIVIFSPWGRGLLRSTSPPTFEVEEGEGTVASNPKPGASSFAVATEGGEAFVGHTAEISSCEFSPDKRYIISTSSLSILVWEVATKAVVFQVAHNTRYAFFADDSTIISLGRKGMVRTWEFPGGKELRQVPFTGCRWRAARALDSHFVFYDTESPTVLFDLSLHEDIRTFPSTGSIATGVAISPDGQRAVAGDLNGRVRIWDTETGELIRELPQQGNYVQAVGISPDKSLVLTASWDGTARLYTLATGAEKRRHRLPLPYAAAFTRDGTRYAVAGEGVLTVFDTESGDKIKELKGHNGQLVTCLTFSGDGAQLLSGGRDQAVRLWDLSE